MSDVGRRPAEDACKIIMVMGLPRSGTTWLGKIFDCHPQTFYSHEPDSVHRFRDVPLLVAHEAIEEYRSALLRHVDAIREVRSIRVLGKMPLFGRGMKQDSRTSRERQAFTR